MTKNNPEEVASGEVDKESFLKRAGHESWEIVKVLMISLAIVLPIRYFVAQPFIVRGASMEPNFEDREYLIIDELSYYFREPRRGDVVVFRYPKDPQQFFIKRVIGLPGERVVIKNGRVHIISSLHPEGLLIKEEYLVPPNRPTYPEKEVTVPPDQIFVLGDNRDFSSDSRVWGFLPKTLIVGRALFRAWPLDRFGVIPETSL